MLPQYSVKRSRRKTVSIQISERNGVTVYAPIHLPQTKIDFLLKSKQDWIFSKLNENLQSLSLHPDFNLFESSTIPLLGKPYSIQFFSKPEQKTVSFELSCDHDTFYVLLPSPQPNEHLIQTRFLNWIRRFALTTIQSRLDVYAPLITRPYTGVSIRSNTSRWGSCSSLGRLNFSWPLITTPLEIVDYVVVHELCHLIHMNHSAAFWKLVRSLYPNADQCRKWLKTNGHVLRQFLTASAQSGFAE